MAVHHTHSAHTEGSTATFAGAGLRTAWRWPAIVMLLVTAVAHIPVVAPHLEEAPYIGVLFIVLIVASFLLVAALLIRDSAAIWTLTAITSGLAFLAYVLSRTVGLPEIGDDIGEWVSTLGIASIVSEGITFIIAVVVLAGGRGRRARPAANQG